MTTNLFRTAITCRWGKFIGDALLNSIDAVNFQPYLSPESKLSLIVGVNNQISSSNQQVFPTVNPIDAVSWADTSGRVGLATVSAIREEGVLSAKTGNTVFGGTGSKTVIFTVPTNERWIIKAAELVYSGTFTATADGFEIQANGVNVGVWQRTTGAGTQVSIPFYQSITVPPGSSIFSFSTVTADTNGQVTLNLLYQKCDA